MLLAGGQSRRMGRDKALLELSGGNLLQRALALLSDLQIFGAEFLPPLVSGGHEEERDAKTPGGGAATVPGSESNVPDRVPARGPLAGLSSVAEHLRANKIPCDALLIIPVDMPRLEKTQLQQLCLAGLDSAGRPACFGEFFLPLWLPLTPECRAYLRAAEQGEAASSIRALLAQLGGVQLPVPAGDWHHNINTPQDYSDLLRKVLENS